MNTKQPFSPLDHPSTEALLRNPTALRSLLQSAETKQLISLLQKQGNLNAAAQQAKNGDISSLQTMLSSLSKSAEGGKVLADLEEKINK